MPTSMFSHHLSHIKTHFVSWPHMDTRRVENDNIEEQQLHTQKALAAFCLCQFLTLIQHQVACGPAKQSQNNGISMSHTLHAETSAQFGCERQRK